MILMRYQETFWPLGLELSSPPSVGVFDSGGRGRLWLADAPPEDRKRFSEMGHQALSERGLNWHELGGIARAAKAVRRKGKFIHG